MRRSEASRTISELRAEVAALKAERVKLHERLDTERSAATVFQVHLRHASRWASWWKAKAKELQKSAAHDEVLTGLIADLKRDRDELRRLAAGYLKLSDSLTADLRDIGKARAALRAHLEGGKDGG